MQDVTALMGKLQANVSYLQFSDTPSEDRLGWPRLDRLALAQKGGSAAVPASAAPARALLSGYVAPVQVPPARSRKLSDIFSRLQR